MQRDPIPSRCDKRSQTFKHEPTLLKLIAKCNRLARKAIQNGSKIRDRASFPIVAHINLYLVTGQRMQLVYDPPAFVVRHAITAAPRSRSEARMNGAPGSSKEVVSVEC